MVDVVRTGKPPCGMYTLVIAATGLLQSFNNAFILCQQLIPLLFIVWITSCTKRN